MNIIKLEDMENFTIKKKILIITHLYESQTQNYTHYSGIKGFLLAKGLLNEGFMIFVLSNDEHITFYNDYYYINHDLLNGQEMLESSYIPFFDDRSNHSTIFLFLILIQLCQSFL